MARAPETLAHKIQLRREIKGAETWKTSEYVTLMLNEIHKATVRQVVFTEETSSDITCPVKSQNKSALGTEQPQLKYN